MRGLVSHKHQPPVIGVGAREQANAIGWARAQQGVPDIPVHHISTRCELYIIPGLQNQTSLQRACPAALFRRRDNPWQCTSPRPPKVTLTSAPRGSSSLMPVSRSTPVARVSTCREGERKGGEAVD